jgi:hypothetical protein
MADRAGIGLDMLSCYLGDARLGLSRALPGRPVPARELWIGFGASMPPIAQFGRSNYIPEMPFKHNASRRHRIPHARVNELGRL